MVRMIKRLLVETESKSQYEILRESGSKDSGLIVKKIGTEDEGWLVLVGNIRSVREGENIFRLGDGIPDGKVYSESIGLLPDVLDKNPDIVVGKKLFYYNNVRDFDTMQTLFMETTKENVISGSKEGLSWDMVRVLGNSTRVARIISREYLPT